MCIAIPAQVISVKKTMAVVDFGGVRQNVNILLIDDIQTGDYLLIHCGCAIEKINQEEAIKTINLLQTTAKNLTSENEI